VDAQGEAFVAGFTNSFLPTTPGVVQGTFGGGAYDAFVTKFNAAGSTLVYSTFVGGSGADRGEGVALDGAGDAFVVGLTQSSDFPTHSAVQGALSGSQDAFVAKLNPAAATLTYSTYLGGSGTDAAAGVALDGAGAAFVVGATASTDFPTAGGAFQASNGGGANDAFVTEAAPAGNTLTYSTYLGGAADDEGTAVARDPTGEVFLTGFTNSSNFPTANAAYGGLTGTSTYDAFVSKVAPVPAPPALVTITTDSGTYNNDQITTYQNLTLSGTATANATVTLSRAGVGVLGSVAANVSGVWSYDYTGTTLAEGAYAFTATQTVGGLTSAPTNPFLATVDRTAPAVTLTVAASTAAKQPLLQVAASDLNGLPNGTAVGVTVYANDGVTQLYTNASAATLTDGQATFRLPYALTPGTSYKLTASVTDLAGNVGTSTQQPVTVTSVSAWTDTAQVLTSDPLQGMAAEQLGDVQLSHALNLDQSGGGGAALVYNSDGVNVKPIVQATLRTANNAALPGTVTAVLTWNSGTPATFTYSTSADQPGDTLTIAAQVGTAVSSAGRYPWALSIQASGLTTQNLSGTAFVVPQDNSPLGAGWTFGSADRLIDVAADANGPAGKLFAYGAGGFRFFQGTGPFTSPANDDGTLTSASSGGVTTYTYSTPDGQAETFNGSGYETRWASADGQETVQLRYDGSNRLTGVTLIDGALATFTYGTNLLSTVKAVNSRTTTLAYDGTALGSNLTQITNPDGGLHTFSYDANHHVTGETFANLQNEWSYGSAGALATATWGSTSSGGVTNPSTTAVGPAAVQGLSTPAVTPFLASETDATGHTTAWQLDGVGRPVQQLAADGGPSPYALDANGRVTVETDPLGRATTYARDSAGYVTQETLPDGSTRTWQYQSAFHALTTYTDERGATTTSAYDAAGHLTSTTDALGDTTKYGYSAAGLMTTATDPRGFTTSYQYDTNRRLTTVTDALNEVTSYGYDSNGYQQTVTDALGRVTTSLNDVMGRTTVVIDALGNRTTYAYNAAGLELTSTDPLGNQTSTVYDVFSRGLAAQSIEAVGSAVQRSAVPSYDAAGRTTATRDADGWVNKTAFDPVSRASGTTDALGNKTLAAYDLAGQSTASRNQLGNQPGDKYNLRGWVTSSTDALGNVTTTAYDAAGNVTAVTDPLNHTTTYLYDALNRSTGQIDPLNHRTTTTYDADSNVSTTTDANGNVTSYAYDALDRTTMTTEAVGTGAQRTSTVAYDAVGNVTSSTDFLGHRTTTAYDALNRATVATDPLGHSVTTAYDKAGNATTVTDALGRVTSYAYDGLNRLLATTDALGHVVTQVVDAAGDAVASIDPLGHFAQTVYDALNRAAGSLDLLGGFTRSLLDAAGNLTGSVDANGNASAATYDGLYRRVQSTDALGDAATALYDAAGNLTASIDALGRRTSYAYDALNRLTQTTDALNHPATVLYDAMGHVTATADQLGRRTTTAYDALNRVTQVTDALGDATTTLYDALDRVTATVDALGARTSYAYDADGRLTQTTDALGHAGTSLYDAVGNRTVSIDQLGRRTTFAYDALNRVTQTTDALNELTTTVYDAAGNVLATVDARGARTSMGYDVLDRATLTTDPLGHTLTTFYDLVGNVLRTVDALGFSTSYLYDALNRQTQSQDAGGGRVTTAYDAVGNGTVTVDAQGDRTTLSYDALNRVTVSKDALAGVTTTLYDAVGNRTVLTDPVGNTTTFQYDGLNRLTGQTDPLNKTSSVAYDADGRQTSATDRLGRRIDDAFDALGRLTAETWTVSGSTTDSLSYGYDAVGNQTAASDNNGAYTMAYDALNRVTVTQEPFGLTLTSSYDAAGNRTLVQDSFGGVTTSLYDTAGRLTTREFGGAGQTPLRFDTTYTNRDQVAVVTRYSDLAGTTKVGESDYTYDGVGRVTNLQHKNGTGGLLANYTYTYDSASRLTSDTTDGVAVSYGYDNNSQLTSAGAATYSYDANGNRTMTGYTTGADNRLTNDGTYTYTYDNAGELIKKSKGPSAETWTYGYDARGRLATASQYATDGGTLTLALTYTYDVFDHLLAESRWTSGTGTVVTHFGIDGGNTWADLDGSNNLTTRYVGADGTNALEARVNGTGGAVNWLLTDRLGSERLVANGAGTTTLDKIGYDAYGNITSETAPTQAGPFGFTGARQDRDNGAVDDWHRWLLTGPAMWMTPDPLDFGAGDANLRRYVGNDPTNETDPSGEYFVAKDARVADAFQGRFEGYGLHPTMVTLPDGKVYFEFAGAGDLSALPDDAWGNALRSGISTSDATMVGDTGYQLYWAHETWGLQVSEADNAAMARSSREARQAEEMTNAAAAGAESRRRLRTMSADEYAAEYNELWGSSGMRTEGIRARTQEWARELLRDNEAAHNAGLTNFADYGSRNDLVKDLLHDADYASAYSDAYAKFRARQVYLRGLIPTRAESAYAQARIERDVAASGIPTLSAGPDHDSPEYKMAQARWEEERLKAQFELFRVEMYGPDGVYYEFLCAFGSPGGGGFIETDAGAYWRSEGGRQGEYQWGARTEPIPRNGSPEGMGTPGRTPKTEPIIERGPLDWSIVKKKTGETRWEHVQKHGVNDLKKDLHGVFDQDPVLTVQEAWYRAQRLGIKMDAEGTLVVPMGRRVGWEGGRLGSGGELQSVTIHTTDGTKIITAYPSK
jgi:RHS repeat-associated protein